MTRNRRRSTGRSDAASLLRGAAAGEDEAFDGLYRRYAPEAWRFASGVSGVDATARFAVTDGFAASAAAVRDGIVEHPGAFRRFLLQATRVRIVERDDPESPGHTASTEPLASAFATLPELHRTVLWLEHVHHLRPNRIAEVTGTAPYEVVELIRRAHHGLAVHHLGAVARGADATCRRMLRDSARALVRRLPVHQRAAMRTHVASCPTCSAALAPIDQLDARLPALAAPLPEDLVEDTRRTWMRAVAPPTSTGLSPLVERVLAATSAAAAVVAVVGAAYWRGDAPARTIAVSPVLGYVGAPLPDVDGPDLDGRVSEVDEPAPAAPAASTWPTPTAPRAETRGLSNSEATVNAQAGDPDGVQSAPAQPTPPPSEGIDDAPTAGPTPASETDADEPVLTVSLPLGAETLSVNVGGGALVETGPSGDATPGVSGSLIDGLTSVVEDLLG